MMRIGIVNDIPMVAEGLRRVISTSGKYSVAWIASNGLEAVNKSLEDRPDLILMDLIMPVMDGVEATRQITEMVACPILVVTASVDENISDVFRAMSFGALDAVSTPLLSPDGGTAGAAELLRKIETTLQAATASVSQLVERRMLDHRATGGDVANVMVGIGASSGGPRALVRILERLPRDLPCALTVIQHVDEHFAPRLVDWLDSRVPMTVKRAAEGEKPQNGTVYVAVKSKHLIVNGNLEFSYQSSPQDYPYRPSIDVFFGSLADYWNRPLMGVLLTGMGADGALGLKRLHDLGNYTVAQDRASSAVYGMPKVAMELGAATSILSLDHISRAITNFVETSTI